MLYTRWLDQRGQQVCACKPNVAAFHCGHMLTHQSKPRQIPLLTFRLDAKSALLLYLCLHVHKILTNPLQAKRSKAQLGQLSLAMWPSAREALSSKRLF